MNDLNSIAPARGSRLTVLLALVLALAPAAALAASAQTSMPTLSELLRLLGNRVDRQGSRLLFR